MCTNDFTEGYFFILSNLKVCYNKLSDLGLQNSLLYRMILTLIQFIEDLL